MLFFSFEMHARSFQSNSITRTEPPTDPIQWVRGDCGQTYTGKDGGRGNKAHLVNTNVYCFSSLVNPVCAWILTERTIYNTQTKSPHPTIN